VSDLAVVESDAIETTEAGWSIGSLSELEWAMERLAALQKKYAENEALARQALERFQRECVDPIQHPLESAAARMEQAILAYMAEHRAELLAGGKKKSRDLLGGTVGWRKVGQNLVVTDEEACLEWARAQGNPDLLRVKVEVSKPALKAHLDATGEVPDGCEIEPEGEVAFVKPAPAVLAIGDVTPLLKP
jgi:phage host-nuclease inhibitor protein Gam